MLTFSETNEEKRIKDGKNNYLFLPTISNPYKLWKESTGRKCDRWENQDSKFSDLPDQEGYVVRRQQGIRF